MAKTFDEVYSALDADGKAAIQARIDEETNRGIEISTKKGTEFKTLLTKHNALRDSLKNLELDPDADLGEQIGSLKTKAGTSTEIEKQVSVLKKQVESMTATIAEKDRVAAEKTAKFHRAKLSDELQKTLGDKVIGVKWVINDLITSGTVKLSEDESSILWVDNGNEIDFKKGVDSFLKSNTDILKAPPSGGGSKPPDGSQNKKTISRSDFEQMTETDRSSFIKEKGIITD